MDFLHCKPHLSHGDGIIDQTLFKSIGKNVIFESGVLVFHPENISISDNVYVGHNSILKGYHKNELCIKNDVWIGQGCFIHSAGGVVIGRAAGIGPFVKIITSVHKEEKPSEPIISQDLILKEVILGSGCDIGVGAIILPGVKVGEGAIIGAGSVVTHDVPDYNVVAGNPARILRKREI
jgi:acetyltransferase-like isoleucine patch superfamily enzyme